MIDSVETSQEFVEIPPRTAKKLTPALRLKLVAFVLLISEFVRSLGSNLYTISLPLIAQEMTQSAILTGVAIGIFGLVQCFTQYPLGKFSDRFGRRGVLLVSAVVYAVGAILVGLAQNITQFILFRGIQALGAVMSVLQASLSDIFPPERRGSAMAWFSIVSVVSMAIGLPLGGFVAGWFGLRMPFYFNAILSTIAAVILFLFLKESLPSKISPQLELLPAPSSAKDHSSSPDKLTKPFYRVPGFLQACGIGTVVSLGMGAFFAFAPRLLSALGYNALEIGLIFIPGIIVFFCGSMLSGMLSDRIGRKTPILLGLCIAALLSFISFLIPNAFLVPVVIASLFGVAFCEIPISVLVIDLVSEQLRGNAAGVYNMLMILGNALGALLTGFVIQAWGIFSILPLSSIIYAISFAFGAISLRPRKPQKKITENPE